MSMRKINKTVGRGGAAHDAHISPPTMLSQAMSVMGARLYVSALTPARDLTDAAECLASAAHHIVEATAIGLINVDSKRPAHRQSAAGAFYGAMHLLDIAAGLREVAARAQGNGGAT